MRAATVTEFGGPEVLHLVEQPDPVPGRGEVVVAVEVADTLWLETVVRSGVGQDYWPMRPPYVPGNGVAGRLASIGPGDDDSWVGRRVVAHTGNEGGYADRAVVPANGLSLVPDALDLEVAASLLHDGPTSLALFEVTRVGPQDVVLVVGASGGLGILSVQLGRARASKVVAVARGPKLARVRELGPAAVIDSEQPDWVEQVRTWLPDTGADVVLDNIGGTVGEAAFALAGSGGRFSAHGTPSGRFAAIATAEAERRRVTVTGIERVQMSDADRKRYTEQALDEAVSGTFAPVIGQTFPIEEAARAHAAIEGRQIFGKTLLTM